MFYVYVCVCVVREKEKEMKREGDRERKRERGRERVGVENSLLIFFSFLQFIHIPHSFTSTDGR